MNELSETLFSLRTIKDPAVIDFMRNKVITFLDNKKIVICKGIWTTKGNRSGQYYRFNQSKKDIFIIHRIKVSAPVGLGYVAIPKWIADKNNLIQDYKFETISEMYNVISYL